MEQDTCLLVTINISSYVAYTCTVCMLNTCKWIKDCIWTVLWFYCVAFVCSDDDDAEDQCISCIRKAIEHDDTNPEGYQVLADYHLVKAEIEVWDYNNNSWYWKHMLSS